MVDYYGHGFIKYVEYVPEWYRLSNPPLGIAKVHPMSLNIDATMPCVGGHMIFGHFIYPENPPPGFTFPLNRPQPNQLYGRQIA